MPSSNGDRPKNISLTHWSFGGGWQIKNRIIRPGRLKWAKLTAWSRKRRKNDQLDDAVHHYESACKIFKQLWTDHSDTVDYAILLSNSEAGLGITYVSYETDDGDECAYYYLEESKRRLTDLRLKRDLRAWASVVADILDTVDANMAILNGSKASGSGD